MLRNASRSAYSTAGSGLMVATSSRSSALRRSSKLAPNSSRHFPAAEAVARGEVEIAMQQIKRILPSPAPSSPARSRRNDRSTISSPSARLRSRRSARWRCDGEVHGARENEVLVRQERARAAGTLMADQFRNKRKHGRISMKRR